MRELAAILLIAIVASGCVGGFVSTNQPTDTTRTGTQGLVITFVQNQPPSRVIISEGSSPQVLVGMELLNRGAEDITTGILLYSGFDGRLVSWPASDTMPFLEGKSFSNPQGGKEIKEVSGTANTGAIGDVYRPVFQVTACYNYRTNAQIPLCIDPDPNGRSTKPCSAADFSAGGGQGGPIAVSAIDQEPGPGSTLFKITIKNAGGGDVFTSGIQSCVPGSGGGLTYKELDRVKIASVSLGTQPITCRGLDASGNLPLTSGQGVLFCTAQLPRGSSFQTTLNIVMDYQYRTSAQKTVEIVKLT